jgi:outer membrane protein assembly factor BamB
MKQPKKSAITIISENDGWVLVYTLVFLLLIFSISISAYTVTRFRMVSGRGFEHILKNTEVDNNDCTISHSKLPVAEKWDHMIFQTDLIEKKCLSGKNELYWRSEIPNNNCYIKNDIKLSCNRPNILFLVQDSESLRQASGKDYDEKSVYFKNTKGETYVSDTILGEEDYITTPEGIYFKGSYGNSHMKAPASDISGCSGAMPSSTLYMQVIREIAGSVSIAETALASISKGMIIPFGSQRDNLLKMLTKLDFNEEKAGLAKSLYELVDKVPDECATMKHIVFLTDGVAKDDGNIPSWLKDYDRDLNSNDTHIAGTGSHCLDDVSSYAASKGISVHALGPETGFLKSVVMKGKGKYMPGSDDLLLETPFTSTMPVIRGDKTMFIENKFGRFSPSWINSMGAKYYKTNTSGALIQCQSFNYPGPAESAYSEGDNLYISTSGDSISLIDIASGNLKWSIKGPGGRIRGVKGHIVAGPSSDGRISCFRNAPEFAWESDADIFDVSNTMAFLVKDNVIKALELTSGNEVSSISLSEKVTSLNLDPAEGLIYAGTSDGKIFVLNRELILNTTIVTGISDEILEIHAYTFRKGIFLCGYTKDYVFCTDMQRLVWSQRMESPQIIQMLIMDAKVYIVHFSESSPCGGIDTGRSYLSVYDAKTGEGISEKVICSGRLFGPYIDTKNKRLIFSSYDMKVYEYDYSGLYGADRCYLGTRLPGSEL